MSDHFLGQQINIKFYAKLGKTASDTCAVLSKAYEGEPIEKSSVFETHKWFNKSSCVKNHK
jgi:hypothetical protein